MPEVQNPNQMIVGIDPGETTGIVVVLFDGNDNKPTYYYYRELVWGERFIIMPLFRDFFDTCVKENRKLYVVVEDFRLYESKARDQINNRFPSSQVIGAIEIAVWWIKRDFQGVECKVAYQMANMIARTQLPIDTPADFPKSEHARDALKHARYYSIVSLERRWL